MSLNKMTPDILSKMVNAIRAENPASFEVRAHLKTLETPTDMSADCHWILSAFNAYCLGFYQYSGARAK